MKIDLSGKKALVGGSSKGIGLGIARQLAESGASVCLMARNESRLKEIVDQLTNSSNHSYLVVDFSKFEEYNVVEKFSFKKSIVGSGNFKSCQWPIGDPLEEGFHYCGGQNIPTKPYCIEHYKKAYNVDEKYLDKLLDFLHEQN